MNEKIQAILLRIVLELKKLRWTAGPDWAITFKSEGHIPLVKQVKVAGSMGDEEWEDYVETTINLKLASDDQITYFPDYTIYASISLQGVPNKDINYQIDADVAFTEKDMNDPKKTTLAANKINNIVEEYINTEYEEYVDSNGSAIVAYKQQSKNTRGF
jgi:hypothetical protein